jgi:structural maintenance of chromosome 3 (chondroitin sulfate proteoglycan 6)
VSIQCSFNSNQHELKDLQTLSGGQKTIVALSFIFAIQRSDPAPFYLFDEIDAALDPDYRAMVAGKLNECQSNALSHLFHLNISSQNQGSFSRESIHSHNFQ